MNTSYVFRVQQFVRGSWKTKFESLDLNSAHEYAHDLAIVTKEKVRLLRVDFFEIQCYNL